MYYILFFLLLLIIAPNLASNRVFLFRIGGGVASQSFIYYKIMNPGNLLLVLESLEGDADIYVSEKTRTPNYHPENYDFHAATCGADIVTISKSLKRPMTVGIYGYGTNMNKFMLEVYQMPESDSFNVNNEYNDDSYYKEEEMGDANERKQVSKTPVQAKRKMDNIFHDFLSFLELIL